ncbi:MAG: nucleotidyltransferase domain-containing protein [Bacteroidota bacterium]
MIKEKVQAYLSELEEKNDIQILYACESGSRAWGFPSPDSDFDIRFLYVHHPDWYLSINDKQDNLQLMLEDGDIDMSGWELRKALRLLKRSNMALMEWIHSPVVYQYDPCFLDDIQKASIRFYSRITAIHHYLSMSRKIAAELFESESFKLKRFLYALRAATLCRWIVERGDLPPVEFKGAYQNLGLTDEIISPIDKLISLKATKSESYFHSGERSLIDFISDCIDIADHSAKALPSSKGDVEVLDKTLRKYIRLYDHR